MRRLLLPLIAVAASTSACSLRGADSIPLPSAGGSDGYTVTVVFDDATNLVLRETCRSNDVVIGSISSIKLDEHLRAKVTCKIKNSVMLPANAVAAIESTSLLGERFVAIEAPARGASSGRLSSGAVIDAGDSRTDPDVEQVFGALSAVLNGGDIARLGDITHELNAALGGHESDARGVLEKLDALTSQLAAHKDDINRALDSVDRLTTTLAKQRAQLGAAVDAIPAGLAVLERQRTQFVAVLTGLQKLSNTAVPLIERSGSQMIEDLRLLQPTLNGLATNGNEIASALQALSTFPLPSNADGSVRGDYSGIFVRFNLNANTLDGLLHPTADTRTTTANQSSTSPQSGKPSSTPLRGGLLGDLLDGVLAPSDTDTGLAGIVSGLLTGGSR